jgi:hypothetical protein
VNLPCRASNRFDAESSEFYPESNRFNARTNSRDANMNELYPALTPCTCVGRRFCFAKTELYSVTNELYPVTNRLDSGKEQRPRGRGMAGVRQGRARASCAKRAPVRQPVVVLPEGHGSDRPSDGGGVGRRRRPHGAREVALAELPSAGGREPLGSEGSGLARFLGISACDPKQPFGAPNRLRES